MESSVEMPIYIDYEGRNNVYTYMGWQLITDQTSLQWKLKQDAGENFDSEGFGDIDGRYVIACTETFGGVGDAINWELADGTILKTIIGDIKSSGDANWSKYGHIYGNSLSVIEAIVDYNTWYPSHPNPGTPTCKPEWAGQIVSATNVGNYWTGINDVEVVLAGISIISGTFNNDPVFYAGSPNPDGYIYFVDRDMYRMVNGLDIEGTDFTYVEKSLEYYQSQKWTPITGFKLKAITFDASGSIGGNGSEAPNGDVEQAVKWAISIAADDTHGYDQANRNGPDYDCSSLIYHAFHNAGFDVPIPAGNTETMIQHFTNAGFTWMPGLGNSANELIRGDILLNITSHTEIYIGQQQNVGAHINEFGGITGGQTGDQSGDEISVSDWYSYPWDGILRWV